MTVDKTENLIGKPLKTRRPYVFVLAPGLKHLLLEPHDSDTTACGMRVLVGWPRAARATALGKANYCRDCERVVKEALCRLTR